MNMHKFYMMMIKETGVASFDEVFNKAKALNDTVAAAQTELANLNNAIVTAMGLAEGSPIGDAFAQLKEQAPGMLTVTMDGTTPSVATNPEAPDNVKAAVDAVNAAASAIPALIENLKAIPDEAKGVATAAAALPAQVAAEVSAGNIEKSAIMSMTKKVKNNVKATGAIPTNASQVITEAGGLLDSIKGLAN